MTAIELAACEEGENRGRAVRAFSFDHLVGEHLDARGPDEMGTLS
jgi:hypothetical protein